MMTDAASIPVSVLCDYDALYRAIEIKLSALPHVHVTRLESTGAGRPNGSRPADQHGLIIVASLPPAGDPLAMLSRASLLSQVGQVPVLVISDQPSRPESDDSITYLNFPFDLDDLTFTATEILNRHRTPGGHIAGQRG